MKQSTSRMIAVALLLMFFNLLLYAQSSDNSYSQKKALPPTSYGLFIGLVESELIGNLSVDNPERAPGLDLYMHTDVPLNQYLGIRPELRWIFKGGSMYTYDKGGTQHMFDINVKYLEVPVSLTASLRLLKIIRLYAMAGPTFGYNTSATYLLDGTWDGKITDIKPFELGYTYGVGLAVYMLALELRFGKGITTIVENMPENNFKNSYWSITFGLGN